MRSSKKKSTVCSKQWRKAKRLLKITTMVHKNIADCSYRLVAQAIK
jgi:hypothetical protein